MIAAQVERAMAEGGSGADDTLTMDDFVTLVAAELKVAGDSIMSTTRFIEDLQLDAVQMLRLALLLDSLGPSLGVEELARTRRMMDAYRRYVDRRSRARHGDFVCERPSEPAAGDLRAATFPLVSRRTRQRALTRDDDAYVRALLLSDETALPWRRRATSNPDALPEMLWQSVLVQHLVLDAATGAPIGLVSAYDADFATGTAFVSLLVDEHVRGQGWPLEAAALFVNHLFRRWPLRKLYADLLTTSRAAFASGIGGIVKEEGHFVAHEYVAGAWTDVHRVAVFREAWDDCAPALLHRLVSSRPIVFFGESASA